jgi:UMF1 family MFS transporter
MSAAKIVVIGVLVQLAAVFSSIYTPRLQSRLDITNLKLLIWVVILAQVVPIYACLGLILPFGGLRTEGEMYVMATWFGMVSSSILKR